MKIRLKRFTSRALTGLAYTLAALLVVGGTFVLVQVGRGKGYDFRNRRFVDNGLAVFASVPGDAIVTINGKRARRTTPYRATVEVGDYDVTVSKAGFRPWAKRLSIGPTEVTWAQYILLLPETIPAESIGPAGPVKRLVPSRDHRQFAVITSGSEPGVWVLGSDRRAVKVYTPRPANADIPADEIIEDVSWSDDASRLLIKTSYGGKPHFLVVAASSNQIAIDLTDVFRFDFVELKFNPANWRELYWVSPEGLRRLHVEDRTVSAVLADNVAAYTFGGDRIYYVRSTRFGKTLFVMDRAGRDQRELIQSLPESSRYLMTYAKYENEDLLAVLPSDARTVTVYAGLLTPNPTSKVISKSADAMAPTGDGRFLAFWSSAGIGTYDFDKQRVYETALPPGLDSVSWYDNFHLLLGLAGKSYIIEYDGANQGTITDQLDAGQPVLSTGDGKLVLTVQGGRIVASEIRK